MVHLRELCFNDLATINLWRNDPWLTSHVVAPFRYINLETDEKWFNNYMQNRALNVRCAIIDDEEPNQLVGIIGLTDIDPVSRKASYYIMLGDRNHHGKGIGFKATMEILKHAFHNLNLNRVELMVIESNERAISLYEKVGFRREGVQRQAVFKNGQYINLILMAILREDFH